MWSGPPIYAEVLASAKAASRRHSRVTQNLRWTPSFGQKTAVLRWCSGLTKEAAERPLSIPGLNRRSGRIPALPYRPIKHFDRPIQFMIPALSSSLLGGPALH